MSHALQQQIDAVRRRAKRTLLVYGSSCVLSVSLAALFVVGLLDACLRFRDPGIRLICSAGLFGAIVWAFYRFLWPALRFHPRDVDVAQRIEQHQPALRGRLASSVEFLAEDEDDPTAGSIALRRAVISSTAADVADAPLADIINVRPARQAAGWAGVALGITFAVVIWKSDLVAIALTRLALPLGSTMWPRANELVFVQPDDDGDLKIAQGQPFTAVLIDQKGRLPDEVRIEYRYRDGDVYSPVESQKMQQETRTIAPDPNQPGRFRLVDSGEANNDATRPWVMTTLKENVQRPFEFRAVGGDDTQMTWRHVMVLEPPRVESLKLTLVPPEYTQLGPRKSDPRIRALVGTRISIQGKTNKPLVSAAVRLEDKTLIPAQVAADSYGFSIPVDSSHPFIVERTGAYWLELVDTEQVTGGSEPRYEIRALPDERPTVALEQPATDLFVTSEAEIPLKSLVKDDLAIHQVSLRYSRTDRSDAGEFTETLYAGPDQPSEVPASAGLPEQGDTRTIQYVWKLKSLGLKPPVTIAFHVAAIDYKPQSGQSAARQLTIVSPKELEDRLTQRQEYILQELARALKMEQDSRSQVAAIEVQLLEAGRLDKPDIDRLQGVELNQRQVARTLTSTSEGVVALIQSLLADLRSNLVDSPDMQRRMESLLADLTGLGRQELPVIERELTAALKGAQADAADRRTGGALQTAGEHQDQVIATLERWLGNLKQFDNYRRFARDIGQIRREQEELAGDTDTARQQTQGRDLTPQQQADLRKMAQRQSELARRFDKLVQQMDAMRGQLQEKEPIAAETIGDAVTAVRQRGVSNQMNESGQQLAGNQLHQARQTQQQVGERLQELLDILSDRREQELSRLVKKLREAETVLQGLRNKQEGLRKQAEAAARNGNEDERNQALQRLAREEKLVQEEIERFARRLQRLQAEQAARTAAKAGAKAGQAGQAGAAGQGGKAAQDAALAEKDLEEAQQQLAQRRQQAEIDLAQEEVAKLETALKSLFDRQQKVLEETSRLARLKEAQQRLTRAQAESVQELARVQGALREETAATGTKLAAAEVFGLALTASAADMSRAAEMLDRRELGPPAQQAETDALTRLSQILEALAPDKGDAGQPMEDGNGGSGEAGGGDGIHSLAELKLLKLMQLDVNERTRQLDKKLSDKQNLTDDERREYVELGQRQGRLTELILKLSRPTERDPEQKQ